MPRPFTLSLVADITVLVADAQRLFAECLGVMLGREAGLRIAPCHPATGPEVVEAAARHRPGVVVVDYWVPGPHDGPSLIRELAGSEPPLRVLALSWIHAPEHVQSALEAGAAGFLPKSVSLAQVVEGIRRCAAGEPLVYGEQLATLVDDLARRGEEAEERWRRLQTLTAREVEILRLLADGRPGAEVAAELHIALGSLKTRVHRILRKLGVKSQLEAVTMARRERLLEVRVAPGTGGSRPGGNRHYWTP